MRYFFDTEFYEKPGSIELISIGIVAEDGREYYAENSNFNWNLHDPALGGDPWLWNNVLPHLKRNAAVSRKPREIASQIIAFVGEDKAPQFWAYYADYDWVVFCWLFGRMIDLPKGFPMFCRDLKQLMWHLGVEKHQLPAQDEAEHNALADARWVAQAHKFINDKWTLYGLAGIEEDARNYIQL